jgi:hypothetical protein
MWIYSGDTAGFEYLYGFSIGYEDTDWQFKVKAKVIKGKGTIDMRSKLCWAGICLKEIQGNTWARKGFVHGDFIELDRGRLSVVSKKGCTVKLTYSAKRANAKKWKNRSFKIKVKKRR